MDINEAAVGIAIMAFFATEPEDTGHDRIAPFSIGLQNYSGLTTALEDRPFGAPSPIFFAMTWFPSGVR